MIYDIIIIGGGPAGLSAGLYGARSKLSVLVIEKGNLGGQISTTYEVDNYPGSIEECTGTALAKRMKCQAESFGCQFVKDEVMDVKLDSSIKRIVCKNSEYAAKTLIIANGARPKLGGFKNEIELRGRGVSYCATCDADFFEGLDVAVIGGGDSAITEAEYLTKYAESVTVIHRRDSLRAAKSIQEKAFENPKIKFIWNSVVEEAYGDEILDGIIVRDLTNNEKHSIDVNGVFVFIGLEPISSLYQGKINMDKYGYIYTDENMQTSVQGVFAAGDIRVKSLRQAITAASDGAIAAVMAEKHINDNPVVQEDNNDRA